MKHLYLLMLSSLVFFGGVYAATDEDNQIIDALAELEDAMPADLQELNQAFDLTTFSSCDDMTNVMENYIKENFQDSRQYGYGRGG